MMRVAIVTNRPAPYRLPVFDDLTDEYELTVFFTDDRSGNGDRHWDRDVREASFDTRFLPGHRLGPFLINHTLAWELARGDYDVVVVADRPSTIVGRLSTLLYCKYAAVPTIIWTEGIDTPWREKRGLEKVAAALYERVRKAAYDHSDLCLAYSRQAVRFLKRRGVEAEKIVPGTQVMPESLLPDPPEGNRFQDEEFVLSLGYLEERKGIDVLVDAMRDAEEAPGLYVAGEGTMRKRLEELAGEETTFLGFVTESDKAALFDSADVFVLPTRHDAWGLVVNEALYYGTPVVTTSRAGCAELVRETGAGIVVAEPTADEIAEAIDSIYTDYERYADRAKAASPVAVNAKRGSESFKRAIELAGESRPVED